MIRDIKTGSQSTSPSLIILRQSLFMLKLLQNKQDQTGETTDSPLRLLRPSAISGKQTMFTNCKASASKADNNSQHAQ